VYFGAVEAILDDTGSGAGQGVLMKIYLASPLGFSEAGRDFYYRVLIPHLERTGHTVLDLWKLTDPGKIAAVLSLPVGVVRRDA
jgi:hypothetical protein